MPRRQNVNTLAAYIEAIREKLKRSRQQEWNPPVLLPPPEEPGRRRLSWRPSEPREKEQPLTLEQMRDELVERVYEYIESDEIDPLLVRVAAGGGKTYSGIVVAQTLARDGMNVMWAASRHAMFNELPLANAAFDGDLWYHWRPMNYTDDDGTAYCRHAIAQQVWMDRGYRSYDLCTQLCQPDGHMSSECLYRQQARATQPIVFAMHEHLSSGIGIKRPFDVALVDELPMQAFLDSRAVPIGALDMMTTGPLEDLCAELIQIASGRGKDEYLSGRELFDRIGPILTNVFAQIEINDDAIPMPPTIRKPEQVFDVPHFWIMRFLLIAEAEWQCWRNGWDAWAERLRIDGVALVMLWRKAPWGKLPDKLVALDATSRPPMYEKLFDYQPTMPAEEDFPDDYEPPPLGF